MMNDEQGRIKVIGFTRTSNSITNALRWYSGKVATQSIATRRISVLCKL